jgi:hypothetical protein
MDKPTHHLFELFAQLGLPHDPADIAKFIATHAPLTEGGHLPDASFWSPTQAAFLRESLAQDSDWAGVTDQLGKALMSPPQAV